MDQRFKLLGQAQGVGFSFYDYFLFITNPRIWCQNTTIGDSIYFMLKCHQILISIREHLPSSPKIRSFFCTKSQKGQKQHVASPKTLCVNPKTITKSYMASLQGEQQPNHAIICFKLPQPQAWPKLENGKIHGYS